MYVYIPIPQTHLLYRCTIIILLFICIRLFYEIVEGGQKYVSILQQVETKSNRLNDKRYFLLCVCVCVCVCAFTAHSMIVAVCIYLIILWKRIATRRRYIDNWEMNGICFFLYNIRLFNYLAIRIKRYFFLMTLF